MVAIWVNKRKLLPLQKFHVIAAKDPHPALREAPLWGLPAGEGEAVPNINRHSWGEGESTNAWWQLVYPLNANGANFY